MTAVAGGFGPLLPEEWEDAAALVRQGFGIPREYFDRSVELFGPDVMRGLRAGPETDRAGQVVACAAVWPMDQWFGGRPVPSCGVAAVAVDPAERGRGCGSALMRGVLEEARAGGAALSVLYPATLPLYTRLGFGRGGVSFDWSAPPASLAAGPPPGDGRVRRTDAADASHLAALRRSLLVSGNGLVERNEGLWSFALCPDGVPSDVYTLDGPAGPEGYIAVAPPAKRRLAVADLCLLSPRAVRLAQGFLGGYRAQVDRVSWRGGPDDPLILLAPDSGPRADARDEWLLRILDVRRALEARGYPPGIVGELTLDVSDSLIPGNSGCFRLRLSGGKAAVYPLPKGVGGSEKAAGAVLSLSAAALATLYSGHKGPGVLRQVGLLRGGEDAMALAALIFSGPAPWMPDRF
ncbi:GNAT family N-acetyltransferase [Azospirillum isscasi]|uniref:GNAT family N-acetyltransferase n=1 Tax=Azospirillum isscasi TaxID=3053926 RepID=A0ABU0WE49_9PROT|nr:GNAT family N-acetyltransferase [Azospirillum isscasi]MDQ2102353.1 GNAT family N-acetyltransferase [Azospirillum isscasi]